MENTEYNVVIYISIFEHRCTERLFLLQRYRMAVCTLKSIEQGF